MLEFNQDGRLDLFLLQKAETDVAEQCLGVLGQVAVVEHLQQALTPHPEEPVRQAGAGAVITCSGLNSSRTTPSSAT